MKTLPRKKPYNGVEHITEQRLCQTKKTGYRTRKLALTGANMVLRFLREVGKEPPRQMFVYKCPFCRDYHLTRLGGSNK